MKSKWVQNRSRVVFSEKRGLSRFIIVLGLFLTLVGINLYRSATQLDDGDVAPALQLASLDGRVIQLDAFQGSVVLLHFWATWCGPCREEIPTLEALHQWYRSRGLTVVAVSEDQGDVLAAVERFRRTHPFSFLCLADEHGRVADAYQAWGIPESFLIGADGTILHRFSGMQAWDNPAVRSVIETALAQVSP